LFKDRFRTKTEEKRNNLDLPFREIKMIAINSIFTHVLSKSKHNECTVTMQTNDFSSLTLVAIQAALKAGEILRKGFGSAFEINVKPGLQNFVTVYDHLSEESIISSILEVFPSHNILAEERGLQEISSSEDTILWIIDPLDGTTNFAHHLPLFTISIAAYSKGKGLCGVIFQPLSNELFVAEKGKGAYLNGVRLTVSNTQKLDECLITVGLPYDAESSPFLSLQQLQHLSQRGATLRNLGSAALALAYVAAGKTDAFWMYNLHLWDIAAGILLIEEAGGRLTQFEKKPIVSYTTSVLATNQALHQPLLNFLAHSN